MTTQPAGPAVTLRTVARPVMVMKSIRFREKAWERAMAKANRTDENLSEVIRRLVDEWVDDDEEQE